MNDSFRLGADGVYRCDAFQQFVWQSHGFGTRAGNPRAEITLRQIHSAKVWNAAGIGDRQEEGDGLVTNQVGLSIGIRTADCVPILLLDCRTRAVAAVHAGWRGTAAGVVRHAIESMRAEFQSRPDDLYAAIGPCIRGCCYEVGPEVEAHFAPLFPEWQPITGKRLLNLAEANRWQMCAAGIQRERIFDCRLCTTCNVAEFFSYRKEPENPGRLVSSICRLA